MVWYGMGCKNNSTRGAVSPHSRIRMKTSLGPSSSHSKPYLVVLTASAARSLSSLRSIRLEHTKAWLVSAPWRGVAAGTIRLRQTEPKSTLPDIPMNQAGVFSYFSTAADGFLQEPQRTTRKEVVWLTSLSNRQNRDLCAK